MRTPVTGLVAGLLSVAVACVAAAEPPSFRILKLEGNNVRWHKPAQGSQTPIVTYSAVGNTGDFPGARNCRKMAALDGLMASSGVSASSVQREIAAAFAMWEGVANISFRELPAGSRADILIGAQVDPEGWAFADVFYDTASTDRIKPISKALVCLNPAKRWKIGFDGDLQTYDLRYTIAHEIGHAIGLDHPSGAGQIMGYRYEERFRALQPGDVSGAVLLYGERVPESVIVASDPSRQEAARRRGDAERSSAVPEPVERGGTRALDARPE